MGVVFRKAADGTDIIHKERSCLRKKPFEAERAAWFWIRKKRREGARRDAAGVYQCVVCGQWHIGRKPKS